jgi:hypothetical protein
MLIPSPGIRASYFWYKKDDTSVLEQSPGIRRMTQLNVFLKIHFWDKKEDLPVLTQSPGIRWVTHLC